MVKRILTKIFPTQVRFYQTIKVLKNEFAHYKSIKNETPKNKQGEYIPWYTYPAIEYLMQFDFSDKEILEFGSGFSTIFWAERCKKITSIEHNKEWFNNVKNLVKSTNSNLLLYDEDNYAEICQTTNKKFDVIIIDGIARDLCAKEIYKCLNLTTGMVIFDNSDWYPKTSKFIKENLNLFEIDFFGFAPINNYASCTSLFVSQGTVLRPNAKQPYSGIGALKHNAEN